MAFGAGYSGTPQKRVPMMPQKMAMGIGARKPRIGGLAKLGIRTRPSIRHGGPTGHFAGGRRGPFAAMPHSGQHAGPSVRGVNQGGSTGGRYAASPFSGKLARATGYKGVRGDYSAANPQMGFMTSGGGNYTGNGPGGY